MSNAVSGATSGSSNKAPRRRIFVFLIGAVLVLVGAFAAFQILGGRPERPVVAIEPSPPLLLTNITIVETRDGSLSPGMDVLTEAGRIVSVGPSGSIAVPDGIQRVDATGQFLAPGFNDFHAHALDQDDPSGAFALFLANGVTGFRQMGGPDALLRERREGRLPLGRYAPAVLVMTSQLLIGPVNARSPEQARQTVRRVAADGADFIKVGLASPEVFYAALEEASRVGLPFVGHMQENVDAAEASRRGMDAIEHLGPGDTVVVSCSSEEEALRREIAARPPPPFPLLGVIFRKMLEYRIMNPNAEADDSEPALLARIAETFDEAKCRELAVVFVENQTWQVPTLVRERTMSLSDLPEYSNDPNLSYMPAEVVADWRKVTEDWADNHNEAARQGYRDYYALLLRVTKLFDDAGVPMLAGSDQSGAWEVPGFSLHQEFDQLALAGLSPLRILQMTTYNGEAFLNRPGFGRVAPDSPADLVLLDGNPLESVENLHRISAVIRAGYYYSREDLDRMLAIVAANGGYFSPDQMAAARR